MLSMYNVIFMPANIYIVILKTVQFKDFSYYIVILVTFLTLQNNL